MAKLSKLAVIAKDVYAKRINTFSVQDGEDLIREELDKVLNGDWSYRNFMRYSNDFFEIIEQIITDDSSSRIVNAFEDWVEIKDFELGDKIEFTVENTDLFKVAHLADGTNTLRRQRLLGSKVPTEAFRLGIAIYEEFEKFRAGRINWVSLVNKVADSFSQELSIRISKAVQGAYKSLHAKLVYTGTYSDKELTLMIAKVKGLTGKPVKIYGTSQAIANIQGANAITDLEDRRRFGFVSIFNGVPVIELAQGYDLDADEANEWSTANNLIYVLPDGEKIVKCGFEGEAMVLENLDGTVRNDQQIDFWFIRKVHLGVIATARFGVIEIE